MHDQLDEGIGTKLESFLLKKKFILFYFILRYDFKYGQT